MTELRKRMIQDLQLRGLSERTQEAYVGAVKQLALHFQKSPDQITEEELRNYFLYLKNVKNYSRATCTIALCGIKFFYQKTLQKEWTTLELVRPPRDKKLPVVLSREEVRRVLEAVRTERQRVCLTTIYSCGLRIQEGTHLQVHDIDSARMVVHVRHGKGPMDGYVPLPERTLELLRQFWTSHRNPLWIFPAPGRGRIHMPTATIPMPFSSVQIAFKKALKRCGIRKLASVHTLRHSYATHLLEVNVNLRLIQEFLGHRSPRTTAIYTHLTTRARSGADPVIHELMQDL